MIQTRRSKKFERPFKLPPSSKRDYSMRVSEKKKVEKWKSGKVEKWKSGKVEKWKSEKFEVNGVHVVSNCSFRAVQHFVQNCSF